VEEMVHFMADKKQRPSKTVSSDFLPPTRPHLLKLPQPPKIVPLAENQEVNPGACGRHFISKP
jgi:hypothetical protein